MKYENVPFSDVDAQFSARQADRDCDLKADLNLEQ